MRIGKAGLDYLWPYKPAVDFYVYSLRMPYLHTPAFFTGPAFPWMYPAPSIFCYVPFYPFIQPTHWWLNYGVFILVVSAIDLVVAWRFVDALRRCGLSMQHAIRLIAVTVMLGWPLYFAFERGNIELLLWVGIEAGVACFAHRRYAAAATLIGVFGSAKLYPLLLLALFLKPPRFRHLLLGAAAAGGTTLAALRYLEPDIGYAYRQISAGVRLWTELTTLKYWPAGVGPDHSIFGLLREATGGSILQVPHVLNLYLVSAGLVTSMVFLRRVRSLPVPNQVLFIVCAATLLPPTSFDYTLLLQLIPWGWVTLLCVDQARRNEPVERYFLPMALFGIVLAPLTFLHTHSSLPLYFAGPFRCVAMLGLAGVSAWRPLTGEHGKLPTSSISPAAALS